MTTYNNVTSFVNQKLSGLVQQNGWTPITHLDYIGNLANKFCVFSRTRSLTSLTLKGFDDFKKIESLKRIQGKGKDIIFACDTEWMENPTTNMPRIILSWQFAYVKDNELTEVIFVAKSIERLNLLDALGVLYAHYNPYYYDDSININSRRRYRVEYVSDGILQKETFKKKGEAKAFAATVRTTSKIQAVDDIKKKEFVPICLLFHYGFVDITAFDGKNLVPVMSKLSSIQKGLVSLNDIYIKSELHNVKYKTHKRVLPFNLSVRDTMCQGPPGSKTLKDYGSAIGVNKIDIGTWIEKMGDLLITDPKLYFEYASNDAVITLLYAAALYGCGSKPNVTITSASANVMFETLSEYLGVEEIEDFDAKYRGLRLVNMGLHKKRNCSGSPNIEIPYIQATDYEPLNMHTQEVQYLASKAYHGGYNICSRVGYYTNQTYDFDLKNAYPTAMYPIADIDWEKPKKHTFEDFELSELAPQLFEDDTPLQYIVAAVDSFSFPSETVYPCIPLMVNGTPVYPLEYNSKDKSCSDVPSLCLTGPELYLAYKFGAKVNISKAIVLNKLERCVTDAEGNTTKTTSQSLAEAVTQLVQDRALTKKKTLSNNILKVMVNSGYGKIAQNVISKKTWNAELDDMQFIGPSKITNPFSAAMITALVRCTLIAAQEEITKLGYNIYSVTTDGFISDVPENELKSLPLAGFRNLLCQARLGLTKGKDGEIWEIKHHQTDLLNFTTRGNVSMSIDGVCAHNSALSGLPKDSVEDRKWLTTQVLSRKGKIQSLTPKWVTFKEFLKGKYTDFEVFKVIRNLSMDFDMKRKPDRSTFVNVKPIVDDVRYEIANFDTIPYSNISEFKAYRKLKEQIVEERKNKPSRALRTEYDWHTLFWQPLAKQQSRTPSQTKAKHTTTNVSKTNKKKHKAEVITPLQKDNLKKIRNCLYAYNANVFKIPLLSFSKPLFLSELNKSTLTHNTFKLNDLKNYAKKDRIPDVLLQGNEDYVKHFLEEQEPITSFLSSLSAPMQESPENAMSEALLQ